MSTGNLNDGLIAVKDGKMIVLRVPYPMGFYAKGFDGRIDEANAGWKGRGLWTTSGDRAPWLMEGGKGASAGLCTSSCGRIHWLTEARSIWPTWRPQAAMATSVGVRRERARLATPAHRYAMRCVGPGHGFQPAMCVQGNLSGEERKRGASCMSHPQAARHPQVRTRRGAPDRAPVKTTRCQGDSSRRKGGPSRKGAVQVYRLRRSTRAPLQRCARAGGTGAWRAGSEGSTRANHDNSPRG